MMTDLETDAVWAGSSQDSLALDETGARVKESRGRRVSSLGDEVYYVLDTDGGNLGAAGKLSNTNMKHQHSLESYQLYKEKLGKIREKQATMGLEGEEGHLRGSQPQATAHVSPAVVRSGQQTGSLERVARSQTRLNTIQMGLAAIFNPENYIQQQSKKMPFIPGERGDSNDMKITKIIPGAFTLSGPSNSQEEALGMVKKYLQDFLYKYHFDFKLEGRKIIQ